MIMRFFLFFSGVLLLAGCGHTYYIVRHAEKAQPSAGTAMSTPDDPALSQEGAQRAMALREVLKDKKIGAIFTTNTVRTKSTAAPLSEDIHVEPQIYKAVDKAFIEALKGFRKNVLIVGHSNTVDDIVNGLSNEVKIKNDLSDPEYDNLYLVRYKGKKIRFEARKYGRQISDN